MSLAKSQAGTCELSYAKNIDDISQLCWAREKTKSGLTVLPCFLCPEKDPKPELTKKRGKVHIQYIGNTHSWRGVFCYLKQSQLIPFSGKDGGTAQEDWSVEYVEKYMATIRDDTKKKRRKDVKDKSAIDELVQLAQEEEKGVLKLTLESVRQCLERKRLQKQEEESQPVDSVDDGQGDDDFVTSSQPKKRQKTDMRAYNPVLSVRRKKQKLRAGDIISFVPPTGVAGREENHRAIIINVDPKAEFPLKVSTREFLPRDHIVSLVERLQRGKHEANEHIQAMPIREFTLDKSNNGKVKEEDRLGMILDQIEEEKQRLPQMVDKDLKQTGASNKRKRK
jgi:hypothetical protein